MHKLPRLVKHIPGAFHRIGIDFEERCNGRGAISPNTLLANRIIAASTEDNVRPRGLCPIAVSPDDREVGELGAALVIDHRKGQIHFSQQDIITPANHGWLNLGTATDRGLELSPNWRKFADSIGGNPSDRAER